MLSLLRVEPRSFRSLRPLRTACREPARTLLRPETDLDAGSSGWRPRRHRSPDPRSPARARRLPCAAPSRHRRPRPLPSGRGTAQPDYDRRRRAVAAVAGAARHKGAIHGACRRAARAAFGELIARRRRSLVGAHPAGRRSLAGSRRACFRHARRLLGRGHPAISWIAHRQASCSLDFGSRLDSAASLRMNSRRSSRISATARLCLAPPIWRATLPGYSRSTDSLPPVPAPGHLTSPLGCWPREMMFSAERWTTCELDHVHWGAAGGAGLLFRYAPADAEPRYLLQRRSRCCDARRRCPTSL